MNKYLLLVTDSHLGINQSSDVWHEIVLNLFKDIRDTCIKRGIRTIVHLGDFFHYRKSTNTKTLEIAYQIESILSEVQHTYIIIGNHDTYFKDQIIPTSLQIFQDSKTITVIDKVTQLENLVLVPWNQHVRGMDARGKYCFGHFEFNGFYMNNNRVCDKGMDPMDIEIAGFEHIYSGHFHGAHTQGNITYLGAPYSQTFNDVDGSKGYYIFDNGKLEFIEFTGAPKFIKIHSEMAVEPEVIEGNVVKLVFTKDYGTVQNEKLVNRIKSFKPFSVSVDFSKISNEDIEGREEEEDSISLLSNLDILKEYAMKKKTPENINKKTLMEMIEKLSEEIE